MSFNHKLPLIWVTGIFQVYCLWHCSEMLSQIYFLGLSDRMKKYFTHEQGSMDVNNTLYCSAAQTFPITKQLRAGPHSIFILSNIVRIKFSDNCYPFN